MEMDSPMTVEPLFHLGMFVRGVVVEDDVDVQILGRRSHDRVHEPEKLLMAMLRHALLNDVAGGDIEGPQTASSCHGACNRG